ncbi:Multidrug resistance operon repressor [Anoxybacillus thermarum]|uniref:Multidrug resistance operon repressor n=1 Tax=Anoxybacillus thermarum TaxID=404937 RepID=A0A0D0RR87_9BACL|nr:MULTISPECIES: MarR family winged helix-turn-helix transcriptional regulator [Anoxybacillus]KIQ94212.1 Multidrug resistance operon repressor [Anoxybacillus thermarum]NNU89486.1 MarR family transcriptional regulator [Anoxybacillus sp. CHMUD]
MENVRELFHTMTKRLGLLDRNCCAVGGIELSLVQSHILYEIDRMNEPSMQQVADAIAMDITTFSRQIQTLVKMNLVKKTPYPQDRRVYILSLTPEGKYVTAKIDAEVNEYLGEVFSHMSEFERETVLRSIRLLNECMEKSSICCKPLF